MANSESLKFCFILNQEEVKILELFVKYNILKYFVLTSSKHFASSLSF